jgi:hypothetical protein
MPQTKADRSAAAKKAAATRKRNQQKQESQAAGKKAAGTRQRHDAEAAASQARQAAKGAWTGAIGGVQASARSAGEALKQAGKAAATTVGAIRKRGN